VVGEEHGGLYGEFGGDDELILAGITVIHLALCGGVMLNQRECDYQRARCPHESSPNRVIHCQRTSKGSCPPKILLESVHQFLLFSSDARPTQKSNRLRPSVNQNEHDDCHTFLPLRNMTWVSTVQSHLHSELRVGLPESIIGA
jgi:hypothetical protein